MNLAVNTSNMSMAPLSRDLMDRALEPHLLIGMPHLTPHGLSETWLMKELGHRHWLMLARDLGMNNADFRTIDGEEAYAAICATSLSEARFDIVKANSILTIRSELSTVSRSQTSTTHDLYVANRKIGRVELISAFVHRAIKGRNQSLARTALQVPQAGPYKLNQLAKTAADIRNSRISGHWGIPVTITEPLRSFRFDPAVSQEFNGAGLFYFAEFQALADRALDAWFPHREALKRRDIFFLGNIERSESLVFDLVAASDNGDNLHGQIRRRSGDPIAKIFMSYRDPP
ncbi:probable biosynthetic protein, Pnap_2097 family [Rhizobium sp. RU20A]|uniref:Pnap_2097 family protein n=1 Tax=Rhizobium sp. RU20A TaxID=1907412 RepID=UPI000956E4A2|nr:Pnap_2097 family protein [Rhizobium sp. RU20A]SIQ02849.1 probable biosynthetic protein, Pnap_2097 family [Rhizobium sp. RU20A]